ncbi:MAG: NUDIX hydrolase [Solirubrobacteraceae bacterium]|jgi:ADP-ribose pyrophosphatase YjhB (NUDIX family)
MATHDKQLYERDPEAWNAYLAEGNASQPRKRCAADVIVRDDQERLLLVNPNYKPDWDFPGGMAEANEAPIDAARRELREELDLRIEIDRLLCVDWIPPHGPWDDTIVFVFSGGVLTADAITRLRIADDELSSFRFCTLNDAASLLRPYVWQRATNALHALATGTALYLHRGSATA